MRRLSRRRFAQMCLMPAGSALVASCGLAAPPVPTTTKGPRIGYLGPNTVERLEGLRRGLRELGYVDGRTIAIEARYTDGQLRDAPRFAAELVSLNVHVIITVGNEATGAAKRATNSIPIVIAVGDPVVAGLVTNLARPEANLTGLSSSASQTVAKRLQLLKESLPNSQRVAVLWNPDNAAKVVELSEARSAATQLGLELYAVQFGSDTNLDNAFREITQSGVDALLVLADAQMVVHRVRIADFALLQRLPAMYEVRDFTEAGGLMNYGADAISLYYRAAAYVDKLVKGAKPADLPVEQPTKFDFIINFKTAQALGLTIPRSVLAQATEVIQ